MLLRKTERGQESTNRSDSSPLHLKERVHHPPGTGLAEASPVWMDWPRKAQQSPACVYCLAMFIN